MTISNARLIEALYHLEAAGALIGDMRNGQSIFGRKARDIYDDNKNNASALRNELHYQEKEALTLWKAQNVPAPAPAQGGAE